MLHLMLLNECLLCVTMMVFNNVCVNDTVNDTVQLLISINLLMDDYLCLALIAHKAFITAVLLVVSVYFSKL